MISRAIAATIVLAGMATTLPFATESDRATIAAGDGSASSALAPLARRTSRLPGVDRVAADPGPVSVGSPAGTAPASAMLQADMARDRKRGTAPLPACSVTLTALRASRSLCRDQNAVSASVRDDRAAARHVL